MTGFARHVANITMPARGAAFALVVTNQSQLKYKLSQYPNLLQIVPVRKEEWERESENQ